MYKGDSMKEDVLEVVKVDKDAELPEYAMDSDVAFDVRANEDVSIDAFEQKEVKTGIKIKIPEGYIGLVRDRVGIVTEMTAHVIAGTFDSNYDKEVSIFIVNLGEESILIERGMRIAQIIVVPVKKLKIKEVKSFSHR